ncbi:MAG: hypothetical protein GY821_16365 [Gammaproteobacteria bacterium]|nr:hypothetical protein [Gammaproteobacteria bacterium]
MFNEDGTQETNQNNSSTLSIPTIDGSRPNSTNYILTQQSMKLYGNDNLNIEDQENMQVMDRPLTHSLPSTPNELIDLKTNNTQLNDTKSVVISSIMADSATNSHPTLNVNQFKSPVYFKNNRGHLARITNPTAQDYLKKSTHEVHDNDEGFFSACRRSLRIGNKDYKALNKEIRESAKWSEDKEANASKASAKEKIELARSFLVKELIINTFQEDSNNKSLTLTELEKFNDSYKKIIDKIVNGTADNNEINQLYNKLNKQKIPSRSNFVRLIKDCDEYAKSYSQGGMTSF